LWSFGTFFSRFGMLYQEKSGNPGVLHGVLQTFCQTSAEEVQIKNKIVEQQIAFFSSEKLHR
jgi:hypothetical protein